MKKEGNKSQASSNNSPNKLQKVFNKKTLKIALIVLVLMALIGGGTVTAVFFSYARQAPSFGPGDLEPAETSYLYDKDGNEITPLHQEQNRTVIPLDNIPEHVQEAFIAIEDERFERHFGVDIVGIMRAGIVNIRQQDILQGASTITMQLTRNAFLTPEQTMKRKIQEAWLAIQIERQYTKEEILEMYLNFIYFGNGAYGIQAAAETYFDKDASELTLAEGAMLAGIPRNPNSNNPFANEERAIDRMNLVIDKMESLGKIESQEASEAKGEELEYGEIREEEFPYPYFVEYVLHNELVQMLAQIPAIGNKENAYNAIYTQGLEIHTTMNPELQKHVEETLDRDEMYPRTWRINMPEFLKAYREAGDNIPADFPDAYIDEENGVPQPQSAFVLADPGSGEIMALGGGRDFQKGQNESLRFTVRRQPGSAIKPIISYAPAFEEDMLAAGSMVADVPFSVGNYSPRSWDHKYWGPITVREALRWSRNIPAVSVLHDLSPQTATDYATQMGINSFTDADRESLAVALGGVSGIPPLEMAQAFATVANMGVKHPLHTITTIKDRNGDVIYEQNTSPETVLSQETAYMVNDILEDAHRNTFTSNIRVSWEHEVAAKTGTTDEERDTYLAAYTPNLVSVFWMGYDFKEMDRISGGHGLSTSFTREIYEEAFNHIDEDEMETFSERRPSGIIHMEICEKCGLKATDKCRKAGTATTEMFTSQTAPRESCDVHEEIEICEESGKLAGPNCPDDSITTEVYYTGEHKEYVDNTPPDEECDCDGYEALPDDAVSLTAEWNDSQESVNLSWSIPEDHVAEIEIRRESPEEETHVTSLESSESSYNDQHDFIPGTQYTYTINAIDDDGDTIDSATASVTIPAEDEDNGDDDDNGEQNGEDEDDGSGSGGDGENDDGEDNGDSSNGSEGGSGRGNGGEGNEDSDEAAA